MREVNPQAWFGEREVFHVPPHFIKSSTPITTDSLNWVNAKLVGRYAFSTYSEDENFFFDSHKHIYFEDPGEAMMYELRWSGSK